MLQYRDVNPNKYSIMSDSLLLNSDAQPVSLLPLSVISWQDAIKYMVLEKANVLSWHENWIVHSANWETRVPSVLMLTEYMKPKTTIRYSKQNVFLRDLYTCQYCRTSVGRRTATLDHVLPTSHGGKTTFENTVTACGPCNANKGNNKKIVPKIKPHRPDYWELVSKRKQMPFELRHPDWALYIGLDQ
jgi:5-methylcytosine-specific restriction endonuclease McrA